MKTIFKIYIMVVRHCAWQILSSLGAELLVAMLGPIGLQVYEKQVQALEAGALEQLVLFLIIMLTVNIVAIIIENLDGLLTQKMQLEITRNFGKPVFEYIGMNRGTPLRSPRPISFGWTMDTSRPSRRICRRTRRGRRCPTGCPPRGRSTTTTSPCRKSSAASSPSSRAGGW